MAEQQYLDSVHSLSERIVEAQRSIRILDSIKWNEEVRRDFFASDCNKQPAVDRSYYRRAPLGYDPVVLKQEFETIERDIEAQLGKDDDAAVLMLERCREYRRVLDMIDARGTDAFAETSRELYGAAHDPFHEGGPTVADLGELLDDALKSIDAGMFLEREVQDLTAEQGTEILRTQLAAVFRNESDAVKVVIADGIVADAAAGSDYIKLRKEAMFSRRELRILEVHEGWVHVGTTINGRSQPWCTFLAKGTPSTTITQEGLAFLTEIITLSSHPARLRRVTDRIRAIAMAEHGGTFLDVFRRLVDAGRTREEAYSTTVRVFRGSTPEGGPFTKDLSYSKGFIEIYNFIRLAVRRGRLDRIPMLFAGKLHLGQIGALVRLREAGVVTEPRFLPPHFTDLNALTAWMTFSNFFNRLDLGRVEVDLASALD